MAMDDTICLVKVNEKERKMETLYKIKGTTKDTTECDCCGRENLKLTVIMAECDIEGNCFGEPHHFGRVCAAKHARRSASEIWEEAKKEDKIIMDEKYKKQQKEADKEYERLRTFVKQETGLDDYSQGLQAMGGFVTMFKKYKSIRNI